MRDESLSGFLDEIGAASTFEAGAETALRRLLEVAERALGQSRFAGRGRLQRGILHLRPSGEYRQLLVLEHDDSRFEVDRSFAPLTSATAWRWMVEHKVAVSVDVARGLVSPHGAAPVIEKGALAGSAFQSVKSRAGFMHRMASHVLVLPLRATGQTLAGFVSLEATCHEAMGQEFIWGACLDELQSLVDRSAPYLLALPLAPTASHADELLPVVGPSMAGLIEMLRVFAQQEETLLVSGPTGSGKSRLARWCHQQSRRQDGPFETLDLNTVPEELQSGELFGWRKGAFTGALRDNEGCVSRVEEGTLFIDEIDKLSLKAQGALLQLLESRTYRPFGSGAERKANVRFIVGTNADLLERVRARAFREDLYYRINVLPVRLPPLDQRPEEIVLWARYMAERRHREASMPGRARLSPEAERLLERQSWPGNLRQLDNIVRRAFTLALIDRAGAADLAIGAEHVRRALAYESGESRRSVSELLDAAAAALVRLAQERAAAGTPLDLDLTDAFRGFVMAAATSKLGSKEEAFRLFGRESLVTARNHTKVLRRELQRVQALCEALGEDVEPILQRLLGD